MISQSLSAKNKKILQEYGKNFQSWLDTKKGKNDLKGHREHEKYYKSHLSKGAINELTEENVVEIFSNLWAHMGWTDKHWVSKRILDKNGLLKLKKELYNLFYGSDEFAERFDSIVNNIAGIGTSIVTELLSMIYPNKFCIWNTVTKQTLKFLNIMLPSEELLKEGRITGEQYKQCIEFMNLIKKDLEPFGVTNFVDLDLFMWNIHDNYPTSISLDKDDRSRLNTTSMWVVRAGRKGEQEKEALYNDLITIGWYELSDLSDFKTKDELRHQYEKVIRHKNKGQISQGVNQVWIFLNEIKVDDLIFLPLMSKQTKKIAIGKVTGVYQYRDTSKDIKHTRNVKWLHKDIPIKDFSPKLRKLFYRRRTVYPINKKDFIDEIINVLKKYHIPEAENFKSGISQPSSREEKFLMTLDDVSRETYFPVRVLAEIEALLEEKKQIIFYGPPGTSKTFLAKKFAEYFTKRNKNVRLVQFHQSYSYEDFIEGIKPRLSDSGEASGFVRKPGIFKNVVDRCISNPMEKFVLIIDEINRANISKVFGELVFLLEYRKEKVSLTYSPEHEFFIPENLYIIGTMNSADRSIAFVDYALRRRFYFKDFYPDNPGDILFRWFTDNNLKDIDPKILVTMLSDINERIIKRLGKEYQIGYSYFMVKNIDYEKVKRIINYSIIPLVEQYYFGKKEYVDEISNICLQALHSIRSNDTII